MIGDGSSEHDREGDDHALARGGGGGCVRPLDTPGTQWLGVNWERKDVGLNGRHGLPVHPSRVAVKASAGEGTRTLMAYATRS
jgi:hypothetical protein